MLFNRKMKSHSDDSCMNKFIKEYTPGKNLVKPDEEILKFGQSRLPKEIVELWKNYGFGAYGNGIINIIDPREYMNSLYSWLGEKDFNKIPIIMTAFGDIFYYRKISDTENDIVLLNIHYRRTEVCAYSCRDFFENYLFDEQNIKNILRKDLYSKAIEKYGLLKENDIFFFVPALVLGGGEDIKYVQTGKAAVHHQVLLQIGK